MRTFAVIIIFLIAGCTKEQSCEKGCYMRRLLITNDNSSNCTVTRIGTTTIELLPGRNFTDSAWNSDTVTFVTKCANPLVTEPTQIIVNGNIDTTIVYTSATNATVKTVCFGDINITIK